MECGQKSVRVFWANKPADTLQQNIKQVLTATYGKTYAMTPHDLTGFQFDSKQLKFSVYLVRPEARRANKSKFLSKRNIHSYVNGKPVEIPSNWKVVFYEIYKEYTVTDTAVPFVLLHMETDKPNSYQQRLSLAMRHISISDP